MGLRTPENEFEESTKRIDRKETRKSSKSELEDEETEGIVNIIIKIQ